MSCIQSCSRNKTVHALNFRGCGADYHHWQNVFHCLPKNSVHKLYLKVSLKIIWQFISTYRHIDKIFVAVSNLWLIFLGFISVRGTRGESTVELLQ